MNAVQRFSRALALLERNSQMTKAGQRELEKKFAALRPDDQQRLVDQLVDAQGEPTNVLSKILNEGQSSFSADYVVSALSLSFPNSSDDFKVFGDLQKRGDFVSLFDGSGVLDSQAAAQTVANAALSLTDAKNSQAVREFEAILLSTLGVGRDPRRLKVLRDALMSMSPEEKARALEMTAQRGHSIGFLLADEVVDPNVRLSLGAFKSLIKHLLGDFEFSRPDREMVAKAFARLSPDDRAQALVAAAKHNTFDIGALENVLKPEERLPFEGFETYYLNKAYVRDLLPEKLLFNDLEEPIGLFNRLSPSDQLRAIEVMESISPGIGYKFAAKANLAEEAQKKHGLWDAFRQALKALVPG